MVKLRLLLFEDCLRNCAGCCNKEYELKSLPVAGSYLGYEQILLTGGEPMLYPEIVMKTVSDIREETDAPILMYTARVEDWSAAICILCAINGITLTLHEQCDVKPFKIFNERIKLIPATHRKSLRLHIFEGVDLQGADTSLWTVRPDLVWRSNCGLPEGEVLMRLPRQ